VVAPFHDRHRAGADAYLLTYPLSLGGWLALGLTYLPNEPPPHTLPACTHPATPGKRVVFPLKWCRFPPSDIV